MTCTPPTPVDDFTPIGFQVMGVTSNQARASWSAPNNQPMNYVVMYREVGSQVTTNLTFPGDPLPDGVIRNLLPSTTYSVQVQAIFGGNSGTTGEFIVTTLPGMFVQCSLCITQIEGSLSSHVIFALP